ncbi:hypothetical protein BZB76_0108 [Actinomadura pelletieri DSM 43383]|uniref:Uncharacterized protein n=2 Tax=Actinomadura pelletieri TaxID=111805 RepID=A0A495QXD1_9ACTN|nr:hypothetical protein BZB76_0108 [Actinomadura pelletieri DSM 43383]
MGVKLPATLAAWYRIHDGVDENRAPSDAMRIAGILPRGWTMLPLEEMANEYLMRIKYGERETGILPCARRPGDTWYGWYVDARKGKPSYGNLGSWGVDEEDDPYPRGVGGWPLPDWLTEIAAALELGRMMSRPDGTEEAETRPALYQGGLTWVNPRNQHLVHDVVMLDGPR